jgi:hypothetical protein
MKPSISSDTIQFPNAHLSRVIQSARGAPARELIDALALPRPRGLVILNGGTAQLDPDLEARLRRALDDGMARLVAEEAIAVITGGTDAGIFHLFGQGLARWGRSAPCIGVAVVGLVTWPGKINGEAALEPNHSHFVLVEGETWGDETGTMYDLAAALAGDSPSVAVFAGGGEIAIREMLANISQNRTMILLAGSGRTVDAVLAALGGADVEDPRLIEIARSGRIVVCDIVSVPESLSYLVGREILRCAGIGED